MGTPSPKSQTCPGLHPEQSGQQGREGILPLCCALLRPQLQGCIQLWVPAQEGQGPAGVTAEVATKMIRETYNLSCEKRLRELRLLSLQKRLCKDLIAAFLYLKEAYKNEGERLFTMAWSDGTRGGNFKFKKSRFKVDMSKKFFTMRIVKHRNIFPREVLGTSYLEVFKAKLDGTLSNLL
ncbi:hypothetical protein DUI87_23006 [Hirundo rustica rustica]|uniref:Uncharacterized protein n=1 Tax=Hirundo rustica rustica TaxID=333673 RepID=A0A3M0JGY2_HIRRU|nr:hypothetical protein DUI87_23006 [Hirundo rustica rustica]